MGETLDYLNGMEEAGEFDGEFVSGDGDGYCDCMCECDTPQCSCGKCYCGVLAE